MSSWVRTMHNGTPILFTSDSGYQLGVVHTYYTHRITNLGSRSGPNDVLRAIVYHPDTAQFSHTLGACLLNRDKFDVNKIVSFPWRDIVPSNLMIHYGRVSFIHKLNILIRVGALHYAAPSHWHNMIQSICDKDTQDITPVSCRILFGDRANTAGIEMGHTAYTVELKNPGELSSVMTRTRPYGQYGSGPSFVFDAERYANRLPQVWQQRTVGEIEMAIRDYESAIQHLPDGFNFDQLF